MAGVALALVVALGWALLSIVVGPLLGFVDRPDGGLKNHTRAAVPLGGVGVFLGIHVGMVVEGIYDAGLATATGLLLLLGLVDDRWGIMPVIRLAVEIVAAVMLVTLADGGWSANPLSLVVGVALVVGLINAVNLFDGLDGLAGASMVVTGLGIAALASVRGFNEDFGFILAAATAGFLVLNWHRARVFLGDNGAYVVGGFLAYGLMLISPEPVDSRIVVAAVLVGVFGLDLATTIIRRRLAGSPLFTGDRSHIYDQLRDRGRTIRQIAVVMAAVQLVYAAAAYGIEQVRNGPARLVLVALVAAGSLLLVWGAGFMRPTPAAPPAGE